MGSVDLHGRLRTLRKLRSEREYTASEEQLMSWNREINAIQAQLNRPAYTPQQPPAFAQREGRFVR